MTTASTALPTGQDLDHLSRYMAKRYSARARAVGLDLEDVAQTAALGMVHALQFYDPTKGRPSTLLCTWAAWRVHTLLRDTQKRRLAQQEKWADVADGRAEGDAERTEERLDAAEVLSGLLAALPERLHRIVTLRFGLDGDGCRTLRKIAGEMGVTTERIRQLLCQGVELMREAASAE